MDRVGADKETRSPEEWTWGSPDAALDSKNKTYCSHLQVLH